MVGGVVIGEVAIVSMLTSGGATAQPARLRFWKIVLGPVAFVKRICDMRTGNITADFFGEIV